jgi:hypothetical protein
LFGPSFPLFFFFFFFFCSIWWIVELRAFCRFQVLKSCSCIYLSMWVRFLSPLKWCWEQEVMVPGLARNLFCSPWRQGISSLSKCL